MEEKYTTFCSDTYVLNEDIDSEVKKGWIPITIAIARISEHSILGCVLMKKTFVSRDESWLPEPIDILKKIRR